MCITDDAKGFRLLDPNTDKISISKDVKFLEKSHYDKISERRDPQESQSECIVPFEVKEMPKQYDVNNSEIMTRKL